MNQVLISLILAGLTASLSLCQESDAAAAPSQTKHRSQFLINRIIKSSIPEDLPRLTTPERLRLYFASTYGVGSTSSAAVAAGFEQWMNTPGEWGHTSDGYRKRFASAYATHVIQGTIEFGASTVLNEDNRYRRSLDSGWWRRSKHAIISAFASTDDAGHQHFSYSRVGAAGATAFIRKTWQPASTAGVGDSLAFFGITVSARVGGNLCREFWPDFAGRLFKRK
jgi:hypothetical protein